jgi:hypothetical protein
MVACYIYEGKGRCKEGEQIFLKLKGEGEKTTRNYGRLSGKPASLPYNLISCGVEGRARCHNGEEEVEVVS